LNHEKGTEAFLTEVLSIIEIDADGRMAAVVSFDPNDIDAAFDELDGRYLVGEATPYAHTWSTVAKSNAAFRHGESAPTTPDCVYVDHRLVRTPLDADTMDANVRAAWDLTPRLSVRITAVHRLTSLGAVITHIAEGTSKDGFDAEWRDIILLTLDGDLIDRCELFDEADLDAALARFDELHSQKTQLENVASRVDGRLIDCYADRDWARVVELLADAYEGGDRRRVVNIGRRQGRDAALAQMQTMADLGVSFVAPDVIAVRGDRLVLSRGGWSGPDQRSDAFHTAALTIVEIDTEERIIARVMFDLDDIDAAFDELETRYLAGEAARYSAMWSVISQGYAALNRHELAPSMSDWVIIDHQVRETFAGGDLNAYARSSWDLMPDVRNRIEKVHRLSNLGAVITHMANGTTQDGFEAEWRMIVLLAVRDDVLNRGELFNETDLATALARFDELQAQKPRLENAATRGWEPLVEAFNHRDVAGWLARVTTDGRIEDRRKGLRAVSVGPERRRAFRALFAAPDSWQLTVNPIAIRGSRLCLTRHCYRDMDEAGHPITIELVAVMQVNDDGIMQDSVSFDIDDIDAAFEELDARYLAGEAVVHAHTWSVITRAYATTNNGEVPAKTEDCVTLDHRQGLAFAPGDLVAYPKAAWQDTPNLKAYVETVHRLSDLGALLTEAAHGTTQDGFDAEWRNPLLMTRDGDLISRYEIFDEADLDAALARFDELQAQKPRLENAAIRSWDRMVDAYNRRDRDGFLSGITVDGRLEDRRKGLRAVFGGPERRKSVHELFKAPDSWLLNSEPIAIRGSRLSLIRLCLRDTSEVDQPITVEQVTVLEVSDGDLLRDTVAFDPEDIDAAFEELESRYAAGEAAEHAQTWSVITTAQVALCHRHELPPTTPDWVNLDHRRGIGCAPGDMTAYIRALWDNEQDITTYIEAVHRLSDVGVVFVQVLRGSSADGFDAEWRLVELMTVEGDLVSRAELFDEADLDTALARFDEISGPTS
jgi:hypothetical protein